MQAVFQKGFKREMKEEAVLRSGVGSQGVSAPLVSVVIVNFNYGGYLKQAIESVLGQNYKPIEIIVVDDGSTDGSRDLIRSYSNRIGAVLKENGGHGSCINAGFAASRGEFLMFLDADDRYRPAAVAEVVEAFQSGAVMVHFRLNLIDSDNNYIAEYPWRRVKLDSGDVTATIMARGTFTSMVCSGNAFRRTVLERLLPLDDKKFTRAPDGYLVHAAPFYGKVAAIQKPLGCYRIHGANDSTEFQARGGLDVEKLRGLLAFSTRELEVVRSHAAARGLTVPSGLAMRHMRHVQLRLISKRLAPESHPFPEDDAWRLGLYGAIAALRNRALPIERRALMALWFLGVAILPGQTSRGLIRLLMLPGAQQRARRIVRNIRRRSIRS